MLAIANFGAPLLSFSIVTCFQALELSLC